MLKCHEIRKRIGGREILRGLDLSIAPGEITAIIGPSGAGKSTLLRALALLDPPDAGSVSVDDEEFVFPMLTKPRGGPWPKVTVVFQQLFLWPNLTIRENVLLPLREATGSTSVVWSEEQSRAETLLELFDLSPLADRFPNQASIGQRQRAALVRAIVLRPRYLLLDEITSALDVEHIGRVLDHLRTMKTQGTGIALVTHLLGFAKDAADQIIFMEDGCITESGRKSLLSNPSTERLKRFLSLVETAI